MKELKKAPVGQIEIKNAMYANPEMVKKLDDMIYYARKGKKAIEITKLLGIEQPQIIYLTLKFFGTSILELRYDEIAAIMKARPQWTQRQIADYLHITLDALRNQLHYKRNKERG